MFKYFQTTTLILVWCFLLTSLWALLVFYWTSLRTSKNPSPASSTALLPGMVLAPLLLTGGYHLLGLNLLFPIHFFAEWHRIVIAAFVPALVLILASGLFGTIHSGIRFEYNYWSQKSFATVATSIGQSLPKALRRLVVFKTLAGAWSRCLPWLFGELIVIEAIFNAPGLGLDAWEMAKTRNIEGLALSIFWLSLLYLACVGISAAINRWIGRRLSSYA
jgi:ABC-type dipeptide/oligopeptide/nickel transport system permease component